jgi:aminopeptidase N
MDLYFKRHDGQAVTCDDFVATMQDASDIDLTLFKRWYSQSGTPQVTVSDHFDLANNRYQLTFKQKNKPTADQKIKQDLHIPIDIELLDNAGNAIDLGDSQKNKVLSLTQKEQTFVFENVRERPVPCLFRGFSAPVKYKYVYTDQQLLHLISFASDDFSRWDAGQSLFNKYLLENVKRDQAKQQMGLPDLMIQGFKSVLTSQILDPALIADMFEFISETGAMELFDSVDIEALHGAREFMLKQLAIELKNEFISAYQSHQVSGDYQPNTKDIANRKLANLALLYISKADSIVAEQLVMTQINNSNNMTDYLGAMIAANSSLLDCRETVLADFDKRWFDNGLVMDKWFALQASSLDSEVLNNVKGLFAHRSFDFSNPNRLRALVGTFVQNNPYYFHAEDGSGYLFLTEQLIKLNEQNPQVASRLITPLIQFKRLDQARIKLIKVQLNRLLKLDNLAVDLFEKVTKALAQ